MNNIASFIKINKIQNPPWNYYFLQNLDEKEYPLYLAKLFKLNTGEKLSLLKKLRMENGKLKINYEIDKNKCKTFNQKIQWFKLYGVTDLVRNCTDKVLVRDYVKEKIGDEYLKPVLQIIPDNYVFARNVSDKANQPILEKLKVKNGKLKVNENMVNQLDHFAIARDDSKIIDFIPNPTDVSTYFDQINWEKLPNSFVLKCNHGCKWHFIIKDKQKYLNDKEFFDDTKIKITGWLEQSFCFWGGFEMQYATSRRVKSPNDILGARTRLCEGNSLRQRSEANDLPERKGCQEKNIEPKILIEPLMREQPDKESETINIYCFNGKPKIIINFFDNKKMSLWGENFEHIENIFNFLEENIKKEAGRLIKCAFVLSKKLAEDFCFVRVDWMIYKNKLYFEELTFTPYSGFRIFKNQKYNLKLGNLMNLKRIKNEF